MWKLLYVTNTGTLYGGLLILSSILSQRNSLDAALSNCGHLCSSEDEPERQENDCRGIARQSKGNEPCLVPTVPVGMQPGRSAADYRKSSSTVLSSSGRPHVDLHYT